ncbi:RING/U-box superfamily protein [Euphorbia peplus]|nr:RING/U-box superfamily protein [Euphorbia peplus]
MPVYEEGSSRIAEKMKLRRPRNQFNRHEEHHLISETDLPNPNPKSKSAISSLFLSKSNAFRGLGCTAGAAQQVSVPAIIRSSAEWEGKRVKKKKNPPPEKRKKKEIMRVCSENLVEHNNSENNNSNNNGSFNPGSCMVIQDVWCGPGIGLSADAVVGSVDCVVSRRNASGRGKIDGEKFNFRERDRERDRDRDRERERERASCLGRRASVNPETVSFLDTEAETETETEPVFLSSRPEPEVFGSRYYRHVRHPSPDGLAEFMMLHNSFIMGGRMDQFSDWRLDIDHMSYEQLLELGERIGYVSTGLKEDEIGRCVRKLKLSIIKDLSSHIHVIPDKKCSICQEDYEGDDDLGKLECGHGFHIDCIKQWLKQKNKCPVCKKEPVARG